MTDKCIKVGMNYMPGWSTPGGGSNPLAPWAIIPADRTPLQGQYDETNQLIIDNQIRQMRDYGIDFVMIDWFFDTTTHSNASDILIGALDHWVNGFMASKVADKPKFCINWANATNASYVTNQGFANAIKKFITSYFSHPNYLMIDGKPVLGYCDIGAPMPSISPTGMGQLANLVNAAKKATINAGYADLYFVAGCSISANYWKSTLNTFPADAVWPLNVSNRFATGTDTAEPMVKKTFKDIDYTMFGSANGIYESWSEGWLASNAVQSGKLKIFIPISAGFDSSPFEPATQLHGIPTLLQFQQHLFKARAFAEANYSKTNGYVIIQSWNEYGEGSMCEPNVTYGFTKLQAIKDILN